MTGVRFVLEDGAAHSVDSSELAFRLATAGAFREAFQKALPTILEPKMTVEVVAPTEFQGAVIGNLNQRKGTIEDTEVREDEFTLTAEVSLNDMFGYSSQLRGLTQGKGEFSMEYKCHQPVMPNIQKEMTDGEFFLRKFCVFSVDTLQFLGGLESDESFIFLSSRFYIFSFYVYSLS